MLLDWEIPLLGVVVSVSMDIVVADSAAALHSLHPQIPPSFINAAIRIGFFVNVTSQAQS